MRLGHTCGKATKFTVSCSLIVPVAYGLSVLTLGWQCTIKQASDVVPAVGRAVSNVVDKWVTAHDRDQGLPIRASRHCHTVSQKLCRVSVSAIQCDTCSKGKKQGTFKKQMTSRVPAIQTAAKCEVDGFSTWDLRLPYLMRLLRSCGVNMKGFANSLLVWRGFQMLGQPCRERRRLGILSSTDADGRPSGDFSGRPWWHLVGPVGCLALAILATLLVGPGMFFSFETKE